ncbi:hypothetical protein FB45DRAFT_477254 [Roridomyces roridus]|uniref:C2 domain-containing protein n=1 Tax=Roridomyces roridus TaxID=1738132 RepID=A0AAD7FSD5_9AGAR|nr:hypothetical protein FB45DRAFT_477254 [Roridomyces roridus]
MADTTGKPCSKRIQFHIDSANLSKNSKKAYVTVKIKDGKERLKTSLVKGQMNPSWHQSLAPTRISDTSEVIFEVKRRSVWPKPNTTRLAVTKSYPLSELLKLQGGNTFLTSYIELPLLASDSDDDVPSSGSLSVNIRELTSLETARISFEMAERMSQEIQKAEVI